MSTSNPGGPSWIERLPKKRIAAGAVFFDVDGRVLLVDPTYVDGWDYPGGVVEADETPYAAACREIEEELALTRELGPMLALDWEPASGPIPVEGIAVVFDGGVLSDQEVAGIGLPPDELRDFAFCRLGDARVRLPAHLWRRVSEAVRAREAGGAVYLENGYPGR